MPLGGMLACCLYSFVEKYDEARSSSATCYLHHILTSCAFKIYRASGNNYENCQF